MSKSLKCIISGSADSPCPWPLCACGIVSQCGGYFSLWLYRPPAVYILPLKLDDMDKGHLPLAPWCVWSCWHKEPCPELHLSMCFPSAVPSHTYVQYESAKTGLGHGHLPPELTSEECQDKGRLRSSSAVSTSKTHYKASIINQTET